MLQIAFRRMSARETTVQERVPRLGVCEPSGIVGVAALAEAVQAGLAQPLQARLMQCAPVSTEAEAAQLLDLASLHRLLHRPAQADALEAAALERSMLFRVDRPATPEPVLRLLAIMAPGDLMVNTPLDFITGRLPVRLDLLYVRPGAPLPPVIPEHDVAFFAVSESDPQALARLAPLYAAWPRPALNDPVRAARLSREGLAAMLHDVPGVCSPAVRTSGRDDLASALQDVGCPAVIRPLGSHAGRGLARLDAAGDLDVYLSASAETRFCVSPFVDYAGPDRLFRKLRLVMIDGEAFLCHLAVSSHWIVHYMSAGMAESADRRQEEAAAMRDFDAGFARRHRQALEALQAHIGLDYYQIDCAELPDGRLLVFEADVAAIIHMLDPPAVFAYKPAHMRRVFSAFGDMLRRRAGSSPFAPVGTTASDAGRSGHVEH